MLRTTLSSLKTLSTAALAAALLCWMPTTASAADGLSPSLTKGGSIRIACLGQLQCLAGDWDLDPGRDGSVTYQVYPSIRTSGRSIWLDVLFLANEHGGDGTLLMSQQQFRLGSSPAGTRVTNVNCQLPPVIMTCSGSSHRGLRLQDHGHMSKIILHGACDGDDRRIGFTATIDYAYQVGTGLPFLLPDLFEPADG